MENVTWYAYALFSATVILAGWLFLKAARYSIPAVLLIAAWTAIQVILGMSGFYTTGDALTAKFPLLVAPPLIFLGSLFFTRKGQAFIDGLNLKWLTIFHVIRIPVELTLLFLFIGKTIPGAMTFEGRNFDIISGLSAPVLFYFVFCEKNMDEKHIDCVEYRLYPAFAECRVQRSTVIAREIPAIRF